MKIATDYKTFFDYSVKTPGAVPKNTFYEKIVPKL